MMPNGKQIICLTILIFLPAYQLQDVAKACERKDNDFSTCVVKSMNAMRQKLKNGLPELKIASLDPMFVPKIQITQGSGPVKIDSVLTNQVFHGLSNYKIIKANIDFDRSIMTFDLTLPYLYVEGDYKIDGQILLLPVQGSGDSWSNYTTVFATGVLKGHPVKKSGKEFLHLDDMKVDLKVKKGVIHMNNLFNGNKELGDAMNKFMTDNWEIVFQELKPAVQQVIELLCKDIALKVLSRYSLEDMFPK
uniref:Protein takeout n=1 Tax=Clastoptera arizonana TaxID=38151 RepID=A0A1B6CP84_9HEMI